MIKMAAPFEGIWMIESGIRFERGVWPTRSGRLGAAWGTSQLLVERARLDSDRGIASVTTSLRLGTGVSCAINRILQASVAQYRAYADARADSPSASVTARTPT